MPSSSWRHIYHGKGLNLIFLLVALLLVLTPLAALNVVSPEGVKAQTGSIDILKWLDTDNNGIRGGDEPLMQGVEFTVSGVPGTFTTDATGHVVVSGLTPGTYTVTETVKPGGWSCTTTNPLTNVDVVADQTTFVEFGNYISPGIAIDRSPASPFYVVNDGTMSERFGWEIRYWSTADYYTFDILAPDGITVVYGPIYFGAADDPHSTFTPPPGAAPIIDSYAAENSPITRSLVTDHWDWLVPLGATPGFYTARIKFYSLEVGRVTPENTGTTTFEVRNKAHLTADITAPSPGTTFSTLQNFTVNATITNTGSSQADNVTATINITGPASTLDPLTKPTSPATIPGSGGTGTVSWDLQCTGPGPVTITVTPAGTDHTSGSPIPEDNINPDSVIVQQELKSHLRVEITSPLGTETYSSLQNFNVNVTVHNDGQAAANGVTATISVTGPATITPPLTKSTTPANIPGGGSATVSWTLQCTGPGAVNIEVTATGTDENTGEPVLPANIEPDSVTVQQELKSHLRVEITSPLGTETYSSLQNFTVNVTVHNDGEAAANGVTATISKTGPATITPPLTKSTTPADIPGGGSATVSWTLQCTGSGAVNIQVTATGTDENTGQPVLPANIEPDSVTVQQELKSHLRVEITLPLGGETYQPGNDFPVNVTVHNDGQADALGVTATITITGLASTLDPLTKSTTPANIPGGGSATVSWTLHCDGEGDVTIGVTATGTDENTGAPVLPANIEPHSVIVHQQIIRGNLEIFKFEDKNGNGVYDPGAPWFETPLQNWAFTVTGGPTPTPGTYYTNGSGLITIPNLIPGDYTATETLQADWQNTLPGGSAPYTQLGTVPPGGTAHVEFGNRYIKKTLKIYKFNDLNGNKVPDPGEGPLGGWEFTISGIGKRVTGSDGWIIINITNPDIYTVTETLKSGWLTTTDNPQSADLITNDVVILYFGNVELVQHPPLVPVIGTWGTALMAAVFAGSLIWVVAIRRRRQTI